MPSPGRLRKLLTYRIALLALLLVLLVVASLRFLRPSEADLAEFVPDNALGYVEINDLPRMINGLTGSHSWRELAIAYQIPEKFAAAGWVGILAKWTGIGSARTVLFARGQVALVCTGIEVRGEEVRPRWTLVIKSHSSRSAVKTLIVDRFRDLAVKGYGSPVASTTEYGGIPISVFSAPEGGRQLLLAQSDDLSLLSNDAVGLQSCLDVLSGRRKSISINPLLGQARSLDAGRRDVFAFAAGDGVARLSQFFAHILGGRVLEGTPLAGMLEGLVSEIASRTLQGMAYSASLESGGLVDKYVLFCKPQVAESLRAAVVYSGEGKPGQSPLLKMVPRNARSATLISIEDPGGALNGVEQIISSNIGAAETFLFHRFMTAARKTFLGLEPSDDGSRVLGRQMAYATFAGRDGNYDRAWMIQGRDGNALRKAADTLLKQQGGEGGNEKIGPFTFKYSRNGEHSYAVSSGLLVLGPQSAVSRLISPVGQSFIDRPGFTEAEARVTSKSHIVSFSDVSDDADMMMRTLARRLKAAPPSDARQSLEKLPLAVSTVVIDDRGLTIQTISPFGNLPQLLRFIDSVF